MAEQEPDILPPELAALEASLSSKNKEMSNKLTRDLITVQNRLYAQLESLSEPRGCREAVALVSGLAVGR